MNIVGSVKNKNCVIVDDIIDSGGTIVNAAKTLKEKRLAKKEKKATSSSYGSRQ